MNMKYLTLIISHIRHILGIGTDIRDLVTAEYNMFVVERQYHDDHWDRRFNRLLVLEGSFVVLISLFPENTAIIALSVSFGSLISFVTAFSLARTKIFFDMRTAYLLDMEKRYDFLPRLFSIEDEFRKSGKARIGTFELKKNIFTSISVHNIGFNIALIIIPSAWICFAIIILL